MTADLVRRERDGRVAILRMNRGAAHPLNLDLVTALNEAVREAGNDPQVGGVVLTGSGEKFFCIGFDIPEHLEGSRDDFARFYRGYSRLCLDLFDLPKPTVAAVAGHATAGGCILALCCDYRVIASGHKLVGMNEVRLGVPIPFVASRILLDLVGSRRARAIVDSGEFYEPDDAVRLGLVDEIAPPEAVLARAVEMASVLGSHPPAGFAANKRVRTEMVRREVEARLDATDREFLDCWYAEAARERLHAAAEKIRPGGR